MHPNDQDILEAIKAQAGFGKDPISEYQINHVYQIGRRAMHEELAPQLTRLGDIVIAVGNRAPPIDRRFNECIYCHNKTSGMITDNMYKSERHKRDCPYRLAREWMDEMRAGTENER